MQTSDLDPMDTISEDRFYDVLWGDVPKNILIIAHEMGLFEFVEDVGRSVEEIASKLNIAQRAAIAIVSVLESNDFLDLIDGIYYLNPIAEKYLIKDSPYYYGNVIEGVKWTAVQGMNSYEGLKQLILTGEQKFQSFDTFDKDPEYTAFFIRNMHQLSIAPSNWWIEKIDLSGNIRFLDVAGGSGAHAIAAMQKWPELEAVVLDLESVCKITHKYFEEYGLAERGKTLVYDLWESELPPANVHFYSNIFHDWSYEQGRFLAGKSFDALEKGGRIIIHEMLYDDDKKGPWTIANYNVAMLVAMQGQQYSGPELSALLRDIGFENIEITPTKGYWSIVTGEKN